ncbi:hypothetical protein POPTR_014G022050v4 [Populus trichocarpa]|uniref:Uncharacterized protein n=1 Tax=Populus trichocarpa TaxID=3694 RepID=A0ACC0RY57_POPTR|nr:hypothetical protein POPTR_014G022050v4 [Populus trichocarpa]
MMDLMGPGLGCYRRGQEVCAWIHGASKHTQSLHWLLGKTNKSFQVFETGNKERKTRIKEQSKFSGREKSFSYFFPPFAF